MLKQMNDENFNKLYDEIYNNYFDKYENIRENAQSNVKSGIFLMIIAFILLFISQNLSNNIILIVIVTIILIFGSRLSLKGAIAQNNYASKFKNEVITYFFKNLDLEYNPKVDNELELSNEYKNACFDFFPFDTYSFDDNITGKIDDNIVINIYDSYITCKTNSGDPSTNFGEVFEGLFAIINLDLEKPVSMRITNESISKKSSISLDNTEFEKFFSVISDDDVIAYRLLTSDIMEQLLDFGLNYNLKFDIAIRKNKLYFRIHTGALFEPGMAKESIKKENFLKYYNSLKLVENLTSSIYNSYKLL